MTIQSTNGLDDQMGPHLDAALTALESAGAIMARLVFLRGEEDARALQTLRLAMHLVQYLRRQEAPPGEHEWHTFLGMTCCRKCGIVRRSDGQNGPCPGRVRVEPRTDLERVALADRGSEADLDPSRIPPRRIEQPWFRRRP